MRSRVLWTASRIEMTGSVPPRGMLAAAASLTTYRISNISVFLTVTNSSHCLFEEVIRAHAKPVQQTLKRVERQVAMSTLDAGDIGPVQAREHGELLLTHRSPLAQGLQRVSHDLSKTWWLGPWHFTRLPHRDF